MKDAVHPETAAGCEGGVGPQARAVSGKEPEQVGGAVGSAVDSAESGSSAGSRPRGGALPLRVAPAALRFDDVYDNHAPALRRVVLTNTDVHRPLRLHLTSGDDALRWTQLRASAVRSSMLWPDTCASNTVAWACAGGLSPPSLRALRHMASNLDVVTCLELAPGADAMVYVEARVQALVEGGLREPREPRGEPRCEPRDPREHHAEARRERERERERECARERLAHMSAYERVLTVADADASSAAPLTLPVHISLCTPEIHVTLLGEHNTEPTRRERQIVIDVGDVEVGERVVRTLRVANVSDIDCFVQVQRTDEDATRPTWLRVEEPATHTELGAAEHTRAAYTPLALPAHAARELELVLQPADSCTNFEQALVVANMHVTTQSVRVLVRANILGAASDEALAVLSENPLDFGDCCGGQWTRQLLVLKNTADVYLDVVFQTDKHVEATFQLAELAVTRESGDEDGAEADDAADDDVPLGGTSAAAAGVAAAAATADVRVPFPADASGSDTASSIASQAGSRVASPTAEGGTEGAAEGGAEGGAAGGADGGADGGVRDAPGFPRTPRIAPSSATPHEPARLASYTVSALGGRGAGAARSAQLRLHDPVAMLRSGGESQHNQVEELMLRPGAQYSVVVSYRPPRAPVDAAYSAGRLTTTSFHVSLDYARATDSVRARGGRQRRTILCHTRTCTPFISVEPKVVDFGLASVGARKTAQLAVTNHSELSTRVMMRVVSKVLSMCMDEVTVPARQTVELKMDFFPRRVNECYRKQITVMNLLNRHNDQICEVRARNVDLQRVSFHSLFYRILTPSGSNFIDFGDVNIHSARVRSFAIENLCATPLSLELSVAHPEDLVLYVPAAAQHDAARSARAAQSRAADAGAEDARSAAQRKERFLDTLTSDTPPPRRRDDAPRALNLAAALRRGSRGRVTHRFGTGVTFKDRGVLGPLAWLDLAAGPPTDAKKMARGRYQALQAAGGGGEGGEAGGAERGTLSRLSNPVDVADLDVGELVAALERQPASLSTFFLQNMDAEERLVRTEINLERALHEAVVRGELVPLGMLQVEAHAAREVVAVYTPNGSTRPHIQGTARKQDSRIFLRLVEFDRRRATGASEFDALRARDVDELPVRDLMVRAAVCRSMLELGQPHINFGHMDKGDRRERKIWIQNRSEWALRYCIRKSGSIASGDIRLGRGRYGIVPGFGKRGVDFTFSPSLSGPLHERLLVENVADHDDDQAVILKAYVRKVPNFTLDPPALDFGACRAGVSVPESVLLSNTTGKPRTFVVAPDAALPAPLPVDVLATTSRDAAARRALTHEEEEEVETLLQKLKIASRKGNVEKLAKYHDRLEHLGLAPPAAAAPPLPDARCEDAADVPHDQVFRWPPERMPADERVLSLTLAPHQSVKLLLRLCVPAGVGGSGQRDVHVALRMNEVKNSDETRCVSVRAVVGEGGAEAEGAVP
ncbi:hypothetical protein MSPP1_004170 [Malassezia sp. CBS 17886]|nr:hypothetical protein MSPP1_004170 [Malassezia sp. CBS 17886]